MTDLDDIVYQNELKHYGIMRKSGRYPWGSGGDEYTRSNDFYGFVDYIRSLFIKDGLEPSDKEIAKAIGVKVAELSGDPRASFSVSDLRSTRTIAKEQIVREETLRVVALRDKGTSPKAIWELTGIPEPTVRLRLKNSENIKTSSLRATAEAIKAEVDAFKIVDVGIGVEYALGVADTKKKAALAVLRDEGYETYNLKVKNVGSKNAKNQLVIVPPGTGFAAARKMVDQVHTMGIYSEDEGRSFVRIQPPLNISSKRLSVNFKEDGGSNLDGAIYVRPGVPDLDMGKNVYAQVRIAVDGTHYLKGMAVIKHDMPDGVDLIFNTNKSRDVGKLGALKDQESDPTNPFGSSIKRQIVDGNGVVKSAINIVNEEGDWDTWRNSLPSQMLSKQPQSLIKSQLSETRKQAETRIKEIESITNAVVRKKALEDYAAQLDSDGVELRAAALPHQRTQVIIPMTSMRPEEIYAPNFETGQKVALIRYPHGGRFEIPEVTVNNLNRTAKNLLGNANDAIGIHPSVAARLSGADFDGDTVVVIPNTTGTVKGAKSMGSQAKVYEEGLKDFEPQRIYGGYKVDANGKGNFKLMTQTGKEMGLITNLITDMSIQGATPEHVVRAVRHSMVVIDAEKHKLDYKSSELQNGIAQLRTLYQGKPTGGASTLLSLATSSVRVEEQKLGTRTVGGPIDKETGALRYEPTGRQTSVYDRKTRTYTDEKTPALSKFKKLELVDDAYDLTKDPNNPVERLYADHANAMKALANETRLKALAIPNPPTNKAAKLVYKDEVSKLVSDLDAAKAQAPLNRRADIIAGAVVKAKRSDDPTIALDRDRLAKVERAAKTDARAKLGLEQPVIQISDRQWDAIQSGAVSPSRLRDILQFADPAQVTKLALPRENTVVTSAIGARARAMLAAGLTTADVASALGISVSTLRAAALRGDL